MKLHSSTKSLLTDLCIVILFMAFFILSGVGAFVLTPFILVQGMDSISKSYTLPKPAKSLVRPRKWKWWKDK